MNSATNQLETPVAFFIYRRASLTAKSFAAISEVRPKRLYVIADGPKNDAEKEKCDQARSVVEQITWPCEVFKNYSPVNLGLRQRTVSGLDWVFAQEPEAIILEDDVVAGKSFFYFCQELLAKYRNDDRIFQISGTTFQKYNQTFECQDDYYFSRIPVVYGWATWRRSWTKYNDTLSEWPKLRQTRFLQTVFSDWQSRIIAQYFFDEIYLRCNQERHYAHWSWQWIFTCLTNNGIVVLPKTDLTSNIGTDQDGTNVVSPSMFTDLAIGQLSLPLRHPGRIIVNENADRYLISLAPGFMKLDHLKRKLHLRLAARAFLRKLALKG